MGAQRSRVLKDLRKRARPNAASTSPSPPLRSCGTRQAGSHTAIVPTAQPGIPSHHEFPLSPCLTAPGGRDIGHLDRTAKAFSAQIGSHS